MRLSRVLFLSAVLASPLPSQAEVLYSQAPVLSSARTSDFGVANGSGFRMFDDFVLSNDAVLERVVFWGVWVGAADPLLPAPAPDASSWNFGFFADNAGLPGAAVASRTMASANVATTLLQTGVFNFGGTDNRHVNVYRVTADLTSPVSLVGGTRYWFSPLTESPQLFPFFAWLGAATVPGDEPVVLDDHSVQHTLGAGQSVTVVNGIGQDRGFRLEGTVAEPTSLALFGLAGMAAVLRRRRGR